MDAPAVRARVKSYTVLYTTQLHVKRTSSPASRSELTVCSQEVARRYVH